MATSHRDWEIGTLILEDYFSRVSFLGLRESHSLGGKTGEIMQDYYLLFKVAAEYLAILSFLK